MPTGKVTHCDQVRVAMMHCVSTGTPDLHHHWGSENVYNYFNMLRSNLREVFCDGFTGSFINRLRILQQHISDVGWLCKAR